MEALTEIANSFQKKLDAQELSLEMIQSTPYNFSRVVLALTTTVDLGNYWQSYLLSNIPLLSIVLIAFWHFMTYQFRTLAIFLDNMALVFNFTSGSPIEVDFWRLLVFNLEYFVLLEFAYPSLIYTSSLPFQKWIMNLGMVGLVRFLEKDVSRQIALMES